MKKKNPPTLAAPPRRPSLAEMKRQAAVAMETLKHFISARQLSIVRSCMRGEEARFFCEKMIELAGIVTTMAATYDQSGKGDDAIVYLHYFAGGSGNWWITEKDRGSEPEPGEPRDDRQHQAFGLANLFGGANDRDAELGYISIEELIANDAELDFHFTPRTLAELKGRAVQPSKVVDFPAQNARTAAAILANL